MYGNGLAFAAALTLVPSVASAQSPPAGDAPRDSEFALRVDSLFQSIIRPDGPGCAVGVYRDGAIVLTRAYGLASVEEGRPITPRTAFNLGSGAKPFTTLAALILEERGVFSLDDDVRRWVPELSDYGTPIRVRDLIQHTSGLRDFGALGTIAGRHAATMAEFVGLMASQGALNFEPGSRHEYSHSDFPMLALVIERAAGVPFGEIVEREVLSPLGMAGSFVSDGRAQRSRERAFGHAAAPGGMRVDYPDGGTVGGTNLFTSVEDLARWDGNFENATVGGAAMIARMQSRPRLVTGETIPYAYGLRLGEHRGMRTVSRAGHDQGMFTHFIRFPDHHLTVATLCNADNLLAWQLGERVADIYLGHAVGAVGRRPAPPTAVTLPPEELARYAGVYRSPDRPWDLLPIEVRSGALVEVLFHGEHDDTTFVMTPAGDGRFFEIGSTGNVGLFTFRPGGSAAPRALEISWNGAPAEVLERVPDAALWRPSVAELAEYAGTWYSHDLDTGWTFEPLESHLVLRRMGRPALSLRPFAPDRFVRGFGRGVVESGALLQFHRDGSGALTHLTVSTPAGDDSARDVRFVRIPGR